MELGLAKYLAPYLLSTLKFVFGPTLGLAAGLSVFEIVLVTTAGMMTTVVVLTYAGAGFRFWVVNKFNPNRRLFTKKTRRFVKIWRKYGVYGVSFLTPLLLMPAGGTLIVIAFGAKRHQVLINMLISAIFWSFVQTIFFKYFSDQITSI
ncbi:MAG: hypothetical protein AAF363_04405 [Bacteroidota bacterium]